MIGGDGKWLPGTIVRTEGNIYYINYDDDNDRTVGVSSDMFRSLGKEQQLQQQQQIGGASESLPPADARPRTARGGAQYSPIARSAMKNAQKKAAVTRIQALVRGRSGSVIAAKENEVRRRGRRPAFKRRARQVGARNCN